jgi:hypothetical protein
MNLSFWLCICEHKSGFEVARRKSKKRDFRSEADSMTESRSGLPLVRLSHCKSSLFQLTTLEGRLLHKFPIIFPLSQVFDSNKTS